MAKLGKIYKDNKGDRYYVQLPGKLRIFCDKQHRTFYSRQHAEWTLSQIAGEIESGTFDETFYSKKKKSEFSFSVYAEQWLARYELRMTKRELSPTYVKEVRRWVTKRFIPHFGEISILEIKGLHIRNFVDSIEGVSLKTRQNIADCLMKLFRDAVDDEIIQKIPKFPKRDVGPEPNWNWASEEVQDAIFNHLDEETFYCISFLATHGCRTGEARALQYQDIDLKNDTVTIRRAFAGTVLRETTKSNRIRVIPLDPSWKELFFQRPRAINPQTWVFSKGGRPISESWMRKKWNEACRAVGVGHVTLYQGTRHSLASQAALRGESLYIISKMLGHTNTKMTERYAHLVTGALRAVQRHGKLLRMA